MTSKAAAALMRLREMDKKYKSKHEDKYLMSSESSKSIVDEKPQQTFRHQLSIKMPDPYEEYVDSNISSDDKKHSLPVKIVSESSKVVSTGSLSSVDSYQEDEQVVKHELTSEKIVINDELHKEESNESISEILEDTQSIPEISAQSSAESNEENLSLNILIESVASVSNQKTETNEEESEGTEEIKEENSDLKESYSAKYSDESFESRSSDVDNSQSKTKTSVQSESKINSEENMKVGLKTSTTVFENRIKFDGFNFNFVKDSKINTDSFLSEDGSKAIEEVISDNSKTRHSKLQESEETSNPTLESSSSSSTHRSTASKKRSLSKFDDKTEEQLLSSQTIVKNNVDEKKKTTKKHSSNLKTDKKYVSKLKIERSSSTSETLVTTSKKSIAISIRSSHTKQSFNSTTLTTTPSSSSSSSSLSSSKLSQIIKHEDSEKLNAQKKRKHAHVKQEQKYISSAMINYLKGIREEQQRLLMWPAHLICPEKIETKIVRPLEFSQNFNFVQCNAEMNKNLDPNFEILRNRILDIRQWLKEQYLLYKENSELAVNVNKNYCPTTLADTKKIIYQLQRKPRTKNKNQ